MTTRIHIKNFDIEQGLSLTEQTFLFQGQQKLQQKLLRNKRKNTRQAKIDKTR